MLTTLKPPTVKPLATLVATHDFKLATVPLKESMVHEAMELTAKLAPAGSRVFPWELFHNGKKQVHRPKNIDGLTAGRIKNWLAEYKPEYRLMEGES